MSENSQISPIDVLFWIEQEHNTTSEDYFMPSDTPVKNPSPVMLNNESRKRRIRHKRAISRLRTYSCGVLEDACDYVAKNVDHSMLPRKPISKFTSMKGDEFLKENSSDIVNLIQYFDDIKSGRSTIESRSNSPEPTENIDNNTNEVNEEYKTRAEVAFTTFSNDITKKYSMLQKALQVSYQTNSYSPNLQHNN